MITPSIYLNLEDDVSRIVGRLKREKSAHIVLVCPRRCLLFSDPINLKLLKKHTDALGKEIFILTMDELGQMYAQQAGFQLKTLPKGPSSNAFSDIRHPGTKPQTAVPVHPPESTQPEDLEPELEAPDLEQKEGIVTTVGNWFGSDSTPARSKGRTAPPVIQQTTLHETSVQSFAEPVTAIPDEIPLESSKPKRSGKMQSLMISGFVIVALAVILALVFIVLPKAEVLVYARTENLATDNIEVSMSTNIQQADASRLVIPAKTVQENVTVRDKFQSQGKKEVGNRAVGKVQLYNFSTQPLNLKASTTVLNVGTKTYVLLDDVSGLRPTTYKNATTKEVDESSLMPPVDVVASAGGESYNLPAGTRVEITNQVFGSQPQRLYAKSQTAISGGTSRFLSVVTEQDLNDAQSQLVQQALEQLRSKLSEQGLALAEQSYVLEQVSYNADKTAGTESPSFEATLQVNIRGMSFSKEQLQKVIVERIKERLTDNKRLESETPDLNYKMKSVDLVNGIAVLSVHYEGKAILEVNLDDVTQDLVGKTKEQANEILRSKAEVGDIEIILAPSWQKNFPLFASKIEVKVVE